MRWLPPPISPPPGDVHSIRIGRRRPAAAGGSKLLQKFCRMASDGVDMGHGDMGPRSFKTAQDGLQIAPDPQMAPRRLQMISRQSKRQETPETRDGPKDSQEPKRQEASQAGSKRTPKRPPEACETAPCARGRNCSLELGGGQGVCVGWDPRKSVKSQEGGNVGKIDSKSVPGPLSGSIRRRVSPRIDFSRSRGPTTASRGLKTRKTSPNQWWATSASQPAPSCSTSPNPSTRSARGRC